MQLPPASVELRRRKTKGGRPALLLFQRAIIVGISGSSSRSSMRKHRRPQQSCSRYPLGTGAGVCQCLGAGLSTWVPVRNTAVGGAWRPPAGNTTARPAGERRRHPGRGSVKAGKAGRAGGDSAKKEGEAKHCGGQRRCRRSSFDEEEVKRGPNWKSTRAEQQQSRLAGAFNATRMLGEQASTSRPEVNDSVAPTQRHGAATRWTPGPQLRRLRGERRLA